MIIRNYKVFHNKSYLLIVYIGQGGVFTNLYQLIVWLRSVSNFASTLTFLAAPINLYFENRNKLLQDRTATGALAQELVGLVLALQALQNVIQSNVHFGAYFNVLGLIGHGQITSQIGGNTSLVRR